MAYCRPDYRLQKAKKLIDSLDDSEDNKLIKYYIEKKEDWIKKQNKRIKEYQDFFTTLNSFLPHRNQRLG